MDEVYGRDWLIETMPEVKRIAAKEVRKARAEEKLNTLRQVILDLMQSKYPSLLPLAQERINTITGPARLQKMIINIALATDEATLHQLFKRGKRH